jgi:hypothetical protein
LLFIVVTVKENKLFGIEEEISLEPKPSLVFKFFIVIANDLEFFVKMSRGLVKGLLIIVRATATLSHF